MTKETISTFLPRHLKHWNPRETSEIQSGKTKNKTPESQRSFPKANPIPRN